MGTRGTVTFYNEHSQEPMICIYQQYDGYISGVGFELANFLKDKKVINGIRSDQSMETGFANGMGCIAAQYIKAQKTRIGGFYIANIGDSEDYDYHVKLVNGEIEISVEDFIGTPQQLLNYEEA
jgi:hypothetical protein